MTERFKLNLGDFTSFIGVPFAEAVLPIRRNVSDIITVAVARPCLVCAVSGACSVCAGSQPYQSALVLKTFVANCEGELDYL